MVKCFRTSMMAVLSLTLACLLPACEKNKGKGWYEKCSLDKDCMEGMACIFNEAGGGFCSSMCVVMGNEDCLYLFGQDSACEVEGYCFKYCDDDSDCPGDAACYNHHDCQVSPSDSGWAHERCVPYNYGFPDNSILTYPGLVFPKVSLVWTGSEYGLAWHQDVDTNNEIFFTRMSPDGIRLGDDVRVTDYPEDSDLPSMAWSGSEYGLAWQDRRDGNTEIYFTYLSSTGEKLGADIRITNDITPASFIDPFLLWTGTEYGLAWSDYRDGNGEVYFTRLSPSGEKAGSDVRITNDPEESIAPQLAWTGSEYGMVWVNEGSSSIDAYFMRLYPSGDMASTARVIPDDSISSEDPSIVWTGSEYGVAWIDTRTGEPEIYFATLSSLGEKIVGDVKIRNAVTESYGPHRPGGAVLVWAGSEYGLGWTDWWEEDWGYYCSEVKFTRISSWGDQIGTYIWMPSMDDGQKLRSIVWTGSEYGITWTHGAIYFDRMNCGL